MAESVFCMRSKRRQAVAISSKNYDLLRVGTARSSRPGSMKIWVFRSFGEAKQVERLHTVRGLEKPSQRPRFEDAIAHKSLQTRHKRLPGGGPLLAKNLDHQKLGRALYPSDRNQLATVVSVATGGTLAIADLCWMSVAIVSNARRMDRGGRRRATFRAPRPLRARAREPRGRWLRSRGPAGARGPRSRSLVGPDA